MSISERSIKLGKLIPVFAFLVVAAVFSAPQKASANLTSITSPTIFYSDQPVILTGACDDGYQTLKYYLDSSPRQPNNNDSLDYWVNYVSGGSGGAICSGNWSMNLGYLSTGTHSVDVFSNYNYMMSLGYWSLTVIHNFAFTVVNPSSNPLCGTANGVPTGGPPGGAGLCVNGSAGWTTVNDAGSQYVWTCYSDIWQAECDYYTNAPCPGSWFCSSQYKDWYRTNACSQVSPSAFTNSCSAPKLQPCQPSTMTQTLQCGTNQVGSIAQQRDLTCISYYGPPTGDSGWYTTSNTCTAAPATCVPSSETETVYSSCPANQTGGLTQRRDSTCPDPYGAPVWGNWYGVSNTCTWNPATCTPTYQTQSLYGSCPANQSGVIQQRRDATCPGGDYGSLSWGDWYTTSNGCTWNTPSCVASSQSRSVACPSGQSGNMTQTDTVSCPGGSYGSPSDSGWVTTNTSGCYYLPTNGTCGSSNSGSSVPAPTSGLCSAGTASSVTTGSNSYSWSCSGANGGTTASCSMTRLVPVNGSCGSSNGGSFSSTPASGLCNAGTAGSVTANATTYTWSCTGINTGTVDSCTAGRIVNGSCGSSNGGSFLPAPTSGLCSAGNATAVTTSGNSYLWSCNGINGGTISSCTAIVTPTNGACGSANGGASLNAPSSGLCSAGAAGSVGASGTSFIWTCSGLNAGTEASCSSRTIINGSCGSAISGGSLSAPTSNLCSSGNPTSVNSSVTTYSWSCNGINGGTIASCTVGTNVNGACGASNNGSFSSAPSVNLCSSGISSAVFNAGNSYTWVCSGANGGTLASCSATFSSGVTSQTQQQTTQTSSTAANGTCGTSGGGSFSSVPSTNLCSAGIASAVSNAGTSYTWVCVGTNGGTIVSCSASVSSSSTGQTQSQQGQLAGTTANGACGSANSGSFSSTPSVNLCSAGIASRVSNIGGSYTWICSGLNSGTTASCSAAISGSSASQSQQSSQSLSGTATNGSCGSSNGGSFSSAPSTNLCSAGITSLVSSFGGSYSWICSGLNSGTTASCTATNSASSGQSQRQGQSLAGTLANGTCGGSNGGSFSSAPSTNLCSAGIASLVSNFGGSFSWICSGVNGGTTASCTASATGSVSQQNQQGQSSSTLANGSCGSSNGGSFSSAPGANLCSAGVSSYVSGFGGSYTWICSGANGGATASCSAAVSSSQQSQISGAGAAVNGTCGSVNGGTVSVKPNSNLCSAGIGSYVSDFGGSYTWICSGANGGTTASCNAQKNAGSISQQYYGGGVPASGTGSVSCTNLSVNLSIGSRGTATSNYVSDLQNFLQASGYLNSNATGYFGAKTLAAVKAFQQANGIATSGFVGPLTRAKISSVSCGG